MAVRFQGETELGIPYKIVDYFDQKFFLELLQEYASYAFLLIAILESETGNDEEILIFFGNSASHEQLTPILEEAYPKHIIDHGQVGKLEDLISEVSLRSHTFEYSKTRILAVIQQIVSKIDPHLTDNECIYFKVGGKLISYFPSSQRLRLKKSDWEEPRY